VQWVPLTLQNRLEAVRSRRVDIDCSTTTWTLSRQKEVDFSLITFVDGATVIASEASDILRFADFKGKRIAVIRGTTTAKVLAQALQSREVSAQVVPVGTRAEGLQLLQAGNVEGFASDRVALIASVLGDGAKSRLRLLDDDFSLEQYALALPRGDHDFRLAVNRVIARLYRTGDIMRIYERWLGTFGRPSTLLYATYFLQSLAE
jgi:ABC-type amino acid transport substrate-binding protein